MSGSVVIPFVLKPGWVRESESMLAVHHTKKPLPYLIKAGASVTVNTNYACTVSMLNDDSATERIVENVVDEAVFEADADSIVFINCIFVDNADEEYRVDYVIDGEFEPLTHVVCGANAYPDGVDEELSLVFVEGKVIQLLVPRTDLAHLNGMIANDAQLTELDDYYTDIVSFYDDLTNINFERKYFAKANISGPGGAFYGTFFMGQSNSTMSRFFLTPQVSNWGCLHETAHSYDAHFTRHTTQVSLVEVWTNVFADYYQYTHFTEAEYLVDGWLYDYGKREQVLGDIISKFHTQPLSAWGLRERLVYLVAFFYRVGHRRLMRDLYATLISSIESDPNFDRNGFKTVEQILRLLDGYGIDVVYVHRLMQVPKFDKILTENILYNENNNVNVYGFLLRPGQLDFALTDHAGVGNAMLEFDETPAPGLIGGQYTLMNSKDVTRSATFVLERNQPFVQLPVGCYKFFYHSGNSTQRYASSSDYVLYDGSAVMPRLNLRAQNYSSLMNSEIMFLGLGDHLFAILTVDYYNEKCRFEQVRRSPHSVFANEVYFSVKVGDYPAVEVNGIQATFDQTVFEYPLVIGEEIEVYHREPNNRLVGQFVFGTDRTQNFIVTDVGLRHRNNNPSMIMLARLENYCEYILLHSPALQNSTYIQNNVYLAHRALPGWAQSSTYPQVVTFLPDTNITAFTVVGADNDKVLQARESNGVLQIATFERTAPHLLYSRYLTFIYIRDNVPMYEFTVNGTEPVYASVKSVLLMTGDRVRVQMPQLHDYAFVVIDGELQKQAAVGEQVINYEWTNQDTFKPVYADDASPPNNSLSLLMLVVGVVIIIVVILLVLYTLMGSAAKTTVSAMPPPVPPPPPRPILVARNPMGVAAIRR
ncbi:viral enhancing factor [Peridroma alphabaculovirus]|uniref:Viral enhancing factor n=1 Tax=Peridroma alphabaculovirus TaxID=1346829 RepID=A0A068LKB3_9ABAC|nr:viral enhancing factor [Peridroma alphabaculovirus]AIE47809.1 viral enhancing factor [Peridroma alphabaculovirus]